MSITRLELGSIVATPGALKALGEAHQEAWTFLQRHADGDWGEIPFEDREENELSLKEGFRILSMYTLSTSVKIWIITEADRSSTTLLLPEEY